MAALREPEPVINTTPLIDLMLVLLVMFIISVPVATQEVPLDLPQPDPVPAPPRPVNRLEVDAAGQAFWNGAPVPDATLRAYLVQAAAYPVAPELHLIVDAETRYERVDILLAMIRRAGITRMGFVGNERFASTLD